MYFGSWIRIHHEPPWVKELCYVIQASVWCLEFGGFVADIISQQDEDCVSEK